MKIENKDIKRVVPPLRFPEFRDTEGWEEMILGEVAKFYKGKGISKSDITINGNIPCIRYGELYTRYGEIINRVESYTGLLSDNLVLSQINDVIIPSSGETKEDIATASCLMVDNVALGGDLNIIRSHINGIFLSYYLNNVKKNEISQLAQGYSVVHLYPEQLKKLNIHIPKSPKEQEKIADCLGGLDNLISAITEKIETLKEYKKGLMQQLFPAEGKTTPALRFPEFQNAGEWKSVILNDILKIGNGKDYKHLETGNIPVYGSGGYLTLVNDHLYEGESVCIGRKGTIDKPIFLTGKFWTVDTLFYTYSFNYCLPKFIYQIFQQINWYKYNEASGVPSLSKTTIGNINILIPKDIAEQERIVDCFSSVDELISAETDKLDQLKVHKKGLMQQLFPTLNK